MKYPHRPVEWMLWPFLERDGALLIRVVVEVQNPDGGVPLARYSLVRWMIDPALGLEELEEEEEAAREEAAGVEGSA